MKKLSFISFQGAILPLIFSAGWMLSPGWAQAQVPTEAIPKEHPVERYEPIWKRSPFTLSSATENSPAGFADKLVLAGVVKIGKESYVSIVDKTTLKRELISSVPNKDGLQLVKLQPSTDLEKVTATVKKGNETATLHYDLNFFKTASVKTPESAAPATPAEAAPEEPASATNAQSPFNPAVRKRPPIPSRPSPSNSPESPKTPEP